MAGVIFLLAAGCSKPANQPISGSVNQQSANQQISPSANQPVQQGQQAPVKEKGLGLDDSNLEKNPKSQATTTSSQQATSTSSLINNSNCLIPPHTGKPDYKLGFIIVSQTVDGSSCNEAYTQIMKGASAQDLLTIAHKIDFDNYEGMGIFVTSIDGVTADSKHFWEFYVNNKSSNVGVSSYTLQDGDKIEWKLNIIN